MPDVFVLIILKENRFIMCYEDEAEMASSPVSLWHGETRGTWEFVPIIVPNMEALFILAESFDKFALVFHDVFTFVPINIHPILLLSILPPELGQPVVCCAS